jgi:hypothetical protein
MKEGEEEVKPADMEVDIVIIEGAKVEENPLVVTQETFADQ